MLWVGGGIFVHGLKDLGWAGPYDAVHAASDAAAGISSALAWPTTALLDGLLGLAIGLALIGAVSIMRPKTGST